MQTLTHIPTAATRSATAIAAGAIVVGAFGVGAPGVWVAVSVALSVAALAAWVDLRSRRIPDELVGLAVLPSVGSAVAALVTGGGAARLLAVVFGIGILALPLLVIHLVSPTAMGFGDVKLAVALGAAIGLVDPVLGLIALCMASALTAAVGIATGRGALPFGPALVIGTVMAIALASAWTERRLTWR
ncbi:MAG: A24 family peptidase [Ilumatobacteraceae bacterium]